MTSLVKPHLLQSRVFKENSHSQFQCVMLCFVLLNTNGCVDSDDRWQIMDNVFILSELAIVAGKACIINFFCCLILSIMKTNVLYLFLMLRFCCFVNNAKKSR